ncbi:MAG: class I SAM-dependent methyltransferase [Thermoflexales bacterium]|nr:class I SAM-dependent methyltransferase [Thermoflexales bacterium]
MNIHDLYRPFLRHFRSRRMQDFYRRFQITPATRVLDVGGTGFNWSLCPFRPNLTLLNIRPPREKEEGIGQWIIADARHLPFKDCAFEVVYSNSVIEHLGTWDNMRQMASEIRRVGIRYFVQTPNRRFPIEPHLLTPFVHWFPKWLQRRLLRNFTLWGLVTHPTPQDCENFLREVRLLDEEELQRLFPDAEIRRERFLGLSKSLTALKL